MKMTKIVGKTADIFYPFCLIFGLYIVVHGHLTPGGGFQGGAVIATGAALLIAAGRYTDLYERMKKSTMKLCELFGLLLFIGCAISALVYGHAFLYNWLAQAGGLFGDTVAYGANPGNLNTAGLIPIMNIAVGVEVLGGLSLVLLYMISGTKEKC